MLLINAQHKALELLKQFKLDDYSFEFDSAKERFGHCNDHAKIIGLSDKLTELNDEQIVTTVILHEIAHALTPGCGHNEIWKRVCLAIGGDGQVLYDSELVAQPTAKWTTTCPNCNKQVQRNRRMKNLYCGTCTQNNGGRARKSFKFKWKENK